jgi:hypothetical protein
MIISHRHRFIFVRTEKTAGSSVEQALAEVCGPEDVITGVAKYHAQCHRPRWTGWLPIRSGGFRRHFPRQFGFHTHATIGQVRHCCGEAVYRSYFKFAIERNPWDRQLSLYCQRKRQRDSQAAVDFQRDMQSWTYRRLHYTRLDNWSVYSIGDRIAVDHVMRYEDLAGGLQHVLRQIGIDAPLPLPHKRSEWRENKGAYRDSYSPELKDLVAQWYRREIEAFGYEF